MTTTTRQLLPKHWILLLFAGAIVLLFGILLNLSFRNQPIVTTDLRQIVAEGSVAVDSDSSSVEKRAQPSTEPTAHLSRENLLSASLMQEAQREIVASVNGKLLTFAELQMNDAVDRAMQALLGFMDEENSQNALDRFVNQEIVWQAAVQESFTISDNERQQMLLEILGQGGKSVAALEQLLAEQQIPRHFFDQYLQRVFVSARFTHEEAARRNITSAELLQALQSGAQISYGPAASRLTQGLQIEPSGGEQPTTESQPTAPVAPQTSTGEGIFPLLQLPPQQVQAVQLSPTVDSESTSPITTSAQSTSPAVQLEQEHGILPGQLAVDFSLEQLIKTNETLSLSQLQGKPVVLSFWVTWCPYCQQQTPVLIEGAARYAANDIQFVGINVKEERAAVEMYVETTGINYPILLDSEGSVAEQYAVSGFPVTYFIGNTGRIVDKHIGALTTEELDGYVKSLLPIAEMESHFK